MTAVRRYLALHDTELYAAIVTLGEGDFEKGRRKLLRSRDMKDADVPTVEFRSDVDPGVEP